MQPINLLAVGQLKTAWLRDGRDEYVKRLQAFCSLHIQEIPASKQTDIAKQHTEENTKIVKALEKNPGKVFLLDDKGEQFTSLSLAELIDQAKDRGETLTFVIGGAYGFSDGLKRTFPSRSLGRITLPHELCQVVFLEQLYRACSINAGKGYHH